MSVPAETLSDIIWWLLQTVPETEIASTQDALCFVNRGWRRTVLSNPRLWQIIYVDPFRSSSKLRFLRAINLAGTLPLLLHFFVGISLPWPSPLLQAPDMEAYLSRFLPILVQRALPRCSQLKLSWSSPSYAARVCDTLSAESAPKLVDLQVMGNTPALSRVQSPIDSIFHSGAPSLTRASFDSAFLICPWGSVRELRLQGLEWKWQDVRVIVMAPHSLTHLFLHNLRYAERGSPHELKSLTLPFLTHLYYCSDPEAGAMMEDILVAFHLPAVHTIELNVHAHFWEKGAVIPSFFSHIRRASIVTRTNLETILDAFPSIKELRLQSQGQAFDAPNDLLRLVDQLSSPICQALQRIILSRMLGEPDLIHIITARKPGVFHPDLSIILPLLLPGMPYTLYQRGILHQLSWRNGALATHPVEIDALFASQ
ncbi:hypothetical protein B0H16DRAFT_1721981 [Mycena metata]|uniref:Uncharacterized protein n=1 Tax=Mycena metata TaxID=1033252 RepID=A0AAD7J5Z7_9AGAR|nr:hypothetical protein B0H16DRAFT_1721981 [Mycena metata]